MGSFFVFLWWGFFLLVALWIAIGMAFPHKKVIALFVPLAFFVFGIFSIEKAIDHFRDGNILPTEVSGIARVVNDPEEKSFFKEVIVEMKSCTSERCPREKILWQAPRTMEIPIGARINFSCLLELPKNFDSAFDYRMFLAKDNVAYVCPKAFVANILPLDREAHFMRLFFTPKRAFEMALNKSLPQPEAGLAGGLIIGGNNRLPDTLAQAFVTAGLSHIIAISGYNIALIAQAFVIFGIAIGLWRRQALWFAIIGIILFIFLVGAPASAVRAGVMGVCVFGALFFGRLSRGINMLLLAGAVMLSFQPLLLRYDIGFQLSFLATLAIILSSPFVRQLLSKEFFGKGAVEIALLTFSVELFVVPVIAYQFHIFSPFALFMNILLLPLVPYAMISSFVSVLGFFIFPGLHVLPAGVAYGFLRIITYAVERLNMVPGAIQEVSLPPSTLLFWYASLFFIFVLIRKHSFKKHVQTKDLQ